MEHVYHLLYHQGLGDFTEERAENFKSQGEKRTSVKLPSGRDRNTA